jgi:hypothetical protein
LLQLVPEPGCELRIGYGAGSPGDPEPIEERTTGQRLPGVGPDRTWPRATRRSCVGSVPIRIGTIR